MSFPVAVHKRPFITASCVFQLSVYSLKQEMKVKLFETVGEVFKC